MKQQNQQKFEKEQNVILLLYNSYFLTITNQIQKLASAEMFAKQPFLLVNLTLSIMRQ